MNIHILYIGKPSYQYGTKLESIIKQNDPRSNLRVLYKTTNETRRYFPTKDKLKPGQKSGVFYQISCLECDHTYIGKTIRQGYRRFNEHEKDVAKAIIFTTKASSIIQERNKIKQNLNITTGHIQKKPYTQPLRRSARLLTQQTKHQSQLQHHLNLPPYLPKSALGKHAFKTGHSINFKNIDILDQDQMNYRLQIKESIQIRSRKPKLNGTDTSVPLYVFPEGLKTHP